MPTVRTTRASSAAPRGADSSTADRRRRPRLRDLCDEVLASFRVAKGRDTLSDSERLDARTLLDRMTPRLSRG